MSRNAKALVGAALVLAVAWSCGKANEPASSSASNSPAPTVAAAPPAPVWNTQGKVARLVTPANIVLADGRAVHVPMLNGVLPYGGYDDTCKRDADLALGRSLLLGKPVTVTAPPRTDDTPSLVPAGHTQADVLVEGLDYAKTFERRVYDFRDKKCPPPTYDPPPAASSGSSGNGGVDVDVDVDRDHGMPDGALTGGYCRKKWWC